MISCPRHARTISFGKHFRPFQFSDPYSWIPHQDVFRTSSINLILDQESGRRDYILISILVSIVILAYARFMINYRPWISIIRELICPRDISYFSLLFFFFFFSFRKLSFPFFPFLNDNDYLLRLTGMDLLHFDELLSAK